MISIKNLNFKINNREILSNISLDIHKGEFAAIIGPNGAGKSTLIKIILGLIKGYEGLIYIENEPHLEWLKKNIIGYLPQKEFFDRSFPADVIDIVLMGLAGKVGLFKKFSKEDYKKAELALEKVNMLQLKNQSIGELSGGQFQRILLARALVSDPDYIFLDEPEAGVDRKTIESFYKILVDLNKEGKTIILVSHDINIITKYCNYLICLNRTLHCHNQTELLNSEILKKTYGDVIQLIEQKYK